MNLEFNHSARVIERLVEVIHVEGRAKEAFNIMKGDSIQVDPIYGQKYQWNPETRELDFPNTPEFSELDMEPFKVPELKK